MGTTEKTCASEDFRRIDLETESRKDGMEKMCVAIANYAKTLDKRSSQNRQVSVMSMLARTFDQQAKFHGESTVYGMTLKRIGEVEDRIEDCQSLFVSHNQLRSDPIRRPHLGPRMAIHKKQHA